VIFNVDYVLDELCGFDITWCLLHLWNLIYKVNTWTNN